MKICLSTFPSQFIKRPSERRAGIFDPDNVEPGGEVASRSILLCCARNEMLIN